MRSNRRGRSSGIDVSAHAERMAMGRQQRERQMAQLRAAETREQRTALSMLHDFENSGLDEDLEALRAGWATSSSATAAASRRGGASSPPSMLDWTGSSSSDLNRRGDMATRRLQNMQYLRDAAAEKPLSPTPQGLLCLTNGSVDKKSGTLSMGSTMRRGPRHYSAVVDDLLDTGSPYSFSSTAAALTNGRTRRWRGPLNADSSDEEDEPGPRHDYGRMLVSQNMHTTVRNRPTRVQDSDDPWDAWEARWAEAFQEFDARERARQAAKLAQEEAERQNLWEEMNKMREDDIRRQQQRSKTAAAKAAARAQEEASRKAKEQYTKTSREAGSSKPSQGSGAGASNSSSAPPRRTVKTPPRETGPRFASFEAYEAAWSKFEDRMKNEKALGFSDIPWPTSLATISGVSDSDSPADRKKKLRGALLRWHPDKWTPVLSRVCEADKGKVTEEVKEVTRRILAEKERFGG